MVDIIIIILSYKVGKMGRGQRAKSRAPNCISKKPNLEYCILFLRAESRAPNELQISVIIFGMKRTNF